MAKILAKHFKIQLFFNQKLPKISNFSPLWSHLAEVHTQEQLTQTSYSTLGARVTSKSLESCLELEFYRFLLNLLYDYRKRSIYFWSLNYQTIKIYNIRNNWVFLMDEQQRTGFDTILHCYNPKIIQIWIVCSQSVFLF